MWSTPDAIIRFNGIFYHLWEAGLLWTCVMILVRVPAADTVNLGVALLPASASLATSASGASLGYLVLSQSLTTAQWAGSRGWGCCGCCTG